MIVLPCTSVYDQEDDLKQLTVLFEELADLCDDVADRPATLTLSLKRTPDDLSCDRIDDIRSLVVAADRERGCRA